MNIELIIVSQLRHIEGFSDRRAKWLTDKISKAGIWNKPLAVDSEHYLVLDGQHRMEAARTLGLTVVPAIKYDYSRVEVWSLRPKYSFNWEIIVKRALEGNIYPYKTVKHRFPIPLPNCLYRLEELRK